LSFESSLKDKRSRVNPNYRTRVYTRR
jgi:hypothetical protein